MCRGKSEKLGISLKFIIDNWNDPIKIKLYSHSKLLEIKGYACTVNAEIVCEANYNAFYHLLQVSGNIKKLFFKLKVYHFDVDHGW